MLRIIWVEWWYIIWSEDDAYPLNGLLESPQDSQVALEVLLLLDRQVLLCLGQSYLLALELPLSVGELLVFLHELFVVCGTSNHELLDGYNKSKYALDIWCNHIGEWPINWILLEILINQRYKFFGNYMIIWHDLKYAKIFYLIHN